MNDPCANKAFDLSESVLQKFASRLRGRLLRPNSSGYDVARQVFNAMIDRRPALIVECAEANDVVRAVQFARHHDLLVSIRGGGHSISGNAVCEGGLLIDLALMKDVQVDERRRIAQAQAGLLLGELDRATHADNLATPLGIISVTGISGLTLGGGIGWLNGKYGLACDNVISVEIVTADGELRIADAQNHPELYWGVRGGGGNFGVVTKFEYQLHPVRQVWLASAAYRVTEAAQARELFRQYNEFAASCPDELTLEAVFSHAPDGSATIDFTGCYCGSMQEGETTATPLGKFGTPVTYECGPIDYIELQCRDDGHFPRGMLHYWKSNFMRSISDGAVEVMMHYNATRPAMMSAPVVFQQMHGAAARVHPTDTAFANRANQHDAMVLSAWQDPAGSETNIEWTRSFWQALQPYAETSVYVNNLGVEGAARVKAAYGVNYGRLLALKRHYDPANFFRMNQNIWASV